MLIYTYLKIYANILREGIKIFNIKYQYIIDNLEHVALIKNHLQNTSNVVHIQNKTVYYFSMIVNFISCFFSAIIFLLT